MKCIDFVRCSVTFGSCREFVDGLNEFMARVDRDEAGCVTSIVRIKNGFKFIPRWGDDISQYKYCDIKLCHI